MISFENALQIVLDQEKLYKKETVNINIFDSLGRVLAENIECDRDLPPFNRVAMDGYACKDEDLFKELEVIDFVAAGHKPSKKVNSGQCSKVMTGCILPEGTDMVFKVELAKVLENKKVLFEGDEKDGNSKNYCKVGEDNKKGDLILTKGTVLHSGHCGILSSLGISSPLVYKLPKVGIIATGDELVEPDDKPEPQQIRNTNSYLLYAQSKKIGCIPKYYGIARDIKSEIDQIFKKAVNECDVVLMTGGVSMGDLDLVPDILLENSFKILFNKVAVKPGKPTTLAVSKNKVCFGMPGNPVSTFMIFEVMVKPFLYKLMGSETKTTILKLPLAKEIIRKSDKRTQWIPIFINDEGEVVPLSYHGSGHFTSLANATGIIAIPNGVKTIEQGNLVDVRQI